MSTTPATSASTTSSCATSRQFPHRCRCSPSASVCSWSPGSAAGAPSRHGRGGRREFARLDPPRAVRWDAATTDRRQPVHPRRLLREAVRFVSSLAAALPLAVPAAAQRTVVDREYDCTIIASTREFPYGVDENGAPSMNAWGQVVFFASSRTEAGERITELRVGRGEVDAQG